MLVAALEFVCTLASPSRISVAPKQNCHPDRSVAKWRDLRFTLLLVETGYVIVDFQLPHNE
jgi:hypothetical protein